VLPHVFGAAAGDSKAVEGENKLDLLLQSIIRGIRPSNVFAAGMSGFQQGDTSQRRSARLEQKRGGVTIQDLPILPLGGGWRAAPQTEGDIIVLSLDEPTPTHDCPREETGSIFSYERERSDPETEGPMAPSTRLKYSRFRGDGSQDVDDWHCEFESIATANQEDPDSRKRVFQGLLKGEALKWYQDVPENIRSSWEELVTLFLKTFREAGGESRALGRLSRISKKPAESVRKYGQRVKALIQQLTSEAAQSMQIEWYLSGFPDKMGFQIRQTRPTTLREAMEAAQNYENSTQSLRKTLRRSEEKSRKHRRRRRKYSSSSDSSSGTETDPSDSPSSEEEVASSSRNRNRRSGNGKDQKGKELVRVKVEEDESRKVMKSIQETLAAINVNLAESRKPRKVIPTSRANVWCSRCGEAGHFPPECNRPPQKRIQYVQPEEEVYYTFAEEEEEEEMAPVYQVQPTYGRGRATMPFGRNPVGPRTGQPGFNPTTGMQPRYPTRPPGYCYNCGSPDHYATNCPFPRQGQGAPLVLPCQNCREYGHTAPQCPQPAQVRPVFKQVEVPPREQTALNYAHTAGTDNPEK